MIQFDERIFQMGWNHQLVEIDGSLMNDLHFFLYKSEDFWVLHSWQEGEWCFQLAHYLSTCIYTKFRFDSLSFLIGCNLIVDLLVFKKSFLAVNS